MKSRAIALSLYESGLIETPSKRVDRRGERVDLRSERANRVPMDAKAGSAIFERRIDLSYIVGDLAEAVSVSVDHVGVLTDDVQ
jgi:hypothetical protein